MSVPERHRLWVDALRLERPWQVNDLTTRLLTEVGDDDLAAVIWALYGSSCIRCLDEPIRALNPSIGWRSFFVKKNTIRSSLKSSYGRDQTWKMLERASAWL